MCAGTYNENVTLGKDLTIDGAQAGVDARERTGDESTINAGAGVGLTLLTGSAGTTIDGFTFSGGTRSINSESGPLTGLTLQNNLFTDFTNAGVFLNDGGQDITVSQNVIDGTDKTGGGGLFHLDTDDFDGLRFLDNNVVNGETATGFFVDGDNNVGASANRTPQIIGNLFEDNNTGANLGSRAFDGGALPNDSSISNNIFRSNNFDGLQGGIQNTTITDNTFDGNGRSGLAFTSFGNTDAARGAQNTTVESNTFTDNSREAIFLSATQAADTISTNTIQQNRIAGNAIGITYDGTETIDAENNWWGCNEGPNEDGCDTTQGDNIDSDPHIVMGIRADPMRVNSGGSSEIIVRFLLNSGQGQPAVARDFPDGAIVEFTGRRAQINPKQVETTNGSVMTNLTTNSKKKAAVVFASLDAERVKERVKIRR